MPMSRPPRIEFSDAVYHVHVLRRVSRVSREQY